MTVAGAAKPPPPAPQAMAGLQGLAWLRPAA